MIPVYQLVIIPLVTSVNDVKYKPTPALLKMKVVRVQRKHSSCFGFEILLLKQNYRCIGELGHWGLGKEELWSICWTVWSICTVSEQVDWFFTWWKSILLSFHLNSVSEGLVGGLFVCLFFHNLWFWWVMAAEWNYCAFKVLWICTKSTVEKWQLFWIVLLICLNAATNL